MSLQTPLIAKFLEIVECLATKYNIDFNIRDYRIVIEIGLIEKIIFYAADDVSATNPLVVMEFPILTLEAIASQEILDELGEYAIVFLKAIDSEHTLPAKVKLGKCAAALSWDCIPVCNDDSDNLPYKDWGKYCCPPNCLPCVPKKCCELRRKICWQVTQSNCYELLPKKCKCKCKCKCQGDCNCGCKCRKVGKNPCDGVKVKDDPLDQYDVLDDTPVTYNFCFLDTSELIQDGTSDD